MTKLKYLSLFVLTAFFVTAVDAQNDNEEAAMIQRAWGATKKEVVKDYMEMAPNDAEIFWPIYNSYDIERKALGSERFSIIKDYAGVYQNMNDAQATDLTKRLFKNNIAIEKLQLKYYKKLSKVISPVEASKFIQVEKYMENIVRSELLESIPFIGDKGPMN